MKKVKLEIVGLSQSQNQSGAFTLVLGENIGNRRLPIIIGAFEAQAIAIELEKMTTSRPLTHDLFKSFAQTFEITITEVLIYNLVEGIFFAKLICTDGKGEFEIDARSSDAIALAVRFNCNIYTYEKILKIAGIVLDEEMVNDLFEETHKIIQLNEELLVSGDVKDDFITKSTEELKNMLVIALEEEKYELASKIRDLLNKRKKS